MKMKKLLQIAIRYLSDSHYRFIINAHLGQYDKMSDEMYLRRKYAAVMDRELNLTSPQTFNEKLQWLKLYDRKPIYTTMVDKYAVKQYVAERIGEEYIIPTIGVWDQFDGIDFDALPNQFVLKCTHDSGGLVICRDKNSFDKQTAKKKIERSLKKNYYWSGREWPYKNVPRKIIAEQYMEDDVQNHLLKDYKIFCFSGEPRIIMTVTGGHNDETKIQRRMYDTEWNLLPIGLHGHAAVKIPEIKPVKLKEMLELAKILSKGIPHVRTDFYFINNQIYFGELTFFHMSGFAKMEPPEWERTFGGWITLPEKRKG